MATISINYVSADSMPFDMASLGASSWACTSAYSNVSNLCVDYLVGGTLHVATGVSADARVDFYAAGTWDGTNYTAGLTGVSARITWGTTGQTGVDSYFDLRYLGSLTIDNTDDDKTLRWGPFSIAGAFGGAPPRGFQVVSKNDGGSALGSSAASFTARVQGIKYDVA